MSRTSPLLAEGRLTLASRAWHLGLLAPLFFVLYGLCNWAASAGVSGPVLSPPLFPGEDRIPFIPWMVIPYFTIDLFYAAVFFVVLDRAQLQTVSRRILFCLLFSSLFFLVLPLELQSSRPETTGVPGFLFDVLQMDQPHNLFPSLHVSLAVVLADAYRRRFRGWIGVVSTAWFGVIIASTLFTYQHHAIDLVGGAAVGFAARALFPMRVTE